MTKEELDRGVELHSKYLRNEPGGKRADLSDANLSGAFLRGAYLSDAVLSGADLSDANLSDANLSVADLSGANLSDAYLSDADLSDANLSGADLRHADLSDADLSGANLSDANLGHADLSGANLSGAKGLPDAPVVKNLFTVIRAGLDAKDSTLEMESYHGDCGSTHCVCGSAIHLAGQAGYDMEEKYGPSVAGALIINASCEYLGGKVPNFTASNEDALKFINKCAEKEAELVKS